MIPAAYSLKRHVARVRAQLWRRDDLAGVMTAPVYVFPDQEAFDSDDVDRLARETSIFAPKLPHAAVIFEVQDRGPQFRTQLVYARQCGDAVEAVYFVQQRESRRWGDVLAHVRFTPDGYAEVETHPQLPEGEDRDNYTEAAGAIVWRALAILSEAGTVSEQSVSRIHRPKLARAGVRGWSWHQVEIVPERLVRRTTPQGGSHASPRWHIRRGHWRQLADGRRVFVRECEVGDPARGGVLKDYIVGEGRAA